MLLSWMIKQSLWCELRIRHCICANTRPTTQAIIGGWNGEFPFLSHSMPLFLLLANPNKTKVYSHLFRRINNMLTESCARYIFKLCIYMFRCMLCGVLNVTFNHSCMSCLVYRDLMPFGCSYDIYSYIWYIVI